MMSFYSIQTNTHAMLSLRIDNTGFDEFSACFQYGAFLFCVRGCFCLLSSRRVFCGHFVIFDGLGSGFFSFLGFVDFGLFLEYLDFSLNSIK